MADAWFAGLVSLAGLLLAATAPPPTAVPTAAVLPLSQALLLGRTQQPQLRAAAAQQQAAEARVVEQFAGLLPQVTGTALYERTTTNFVLRPGYVAPTALNETLPPSTSNSDNFWSLAASGQWLIYDFNFTLDKWRAARYSARALAQNILNVRLTVDYTIRDAYFKAYAMQALMQVGRDSLANQHKHLEQTMGYVQAGTHAEIDLLQARTDYANARVNMLNADNNYASAKLLLNQAMGIVANIDYDVSNAEIPKLRQEDWRSEVLLAEALQQRPEFANVAASIHAAELTVSSFQGSYWPSVTASATYTDQGAALKHLSWNWNVEGLLSWNVFTGFLVEGQIDEARGNLAVLLAQRDALRQQVQIDVEQARLAVLANRQVVLASDEALQNAKALLQAAEARYSTGLGSMIELGDAQLALNTAAAQKIQAAYQLSSARAALFKALGCTDDN